MFDTCDRKASPVVFEQSQRYGQERKDNVERECVLRGLDASQLNDIEGQYGEGYDDRLTHFNTIDTSKNVDGVGAEHSQHAHIHVVQQVCESKSRIDHHTLP